MSTTTAANDDFKHDQTSRANWGWLTALGIGLLVAGLLASISLVAATVFSVLYIAAMMIIGGLVQIGFAFTAPGWRNKTLWTLSGVFYTLAGILAFANPLLASAGISLAVGALLLVAGVMRIASGIREHKKGDTFAVVATGILTAIAGLLVLAAWPAVSLWLLGAILSIDLIAQGISAIGMGLAQRRA